MTRRRSRDKSTAATGDYASVANRLQAWLREHHPLDSTLSGEAERTEWFSVMAHLSSAQGGERAEDRRAHAAAWGLLLVLGQQIDDGHADFRQAANAARDTHALAEAVRRWRSSPPIQFLIESSLRLPRQLAEDTFTTAATSAQTRAAYWRWTAWLAVALGNPWLAGPCLEAAGVAPTREPWWRWTVWLAAAMRARRTEFVMHDMPERFEYVAAVAMELDALASQIAGQLYFRDPEMMVVRRGRPTDHLRRELTEILRRGGFTQLEIADFIEDSAGNRLERLRGRSRRAKRPARSRR